MKTLTIDLEFAENYGVCEAIFLSILRRQEVEQCPERLRTHSIIARTYPIYNRRTYRKAMMHLKELGYIEVTEKRVWKGKYVHLICKLKDKAFKEYRFVE